MTTNFFTQIAALQLTGTFKLAVTIAEDGTLTVSQLFNAACGDKAAGLIEPLNLSGTAEELDGHFFQTITEPTQKVAGLLTNMESHLKSVETARLASKQEQDRKAAAAKAATPKKDADHELPDERAEKKKAYEQALKSIAELKAACKYQEALDLLPAEADYPEKAAELKKLSSELANALEQLKKIRLFD